MICISSKSSVDFDLYRGLGKNNQKWLEPFLSVVQVRMKNDVPFSLVLNSTGL